MSLWSSFRNWLAGPPHVDSRGDAEAGAVLQEEFDAPDPGETYLDKSEPLSGGAVVPGQAAAEAVETAEEDLSSEETPPDPDP
jgi:hypothetical protein